MATTGNETEKISSDLNSVKDRDWILYHLGYKAINAVKNAAVNTYGVSSVAAAAVKDNGSQMAKDAFCGTVNLGAKAVNAVKENGPDLVKPYIPGPERVEQISSYVTHPATREMAKYFVPGVTPALGIAGALLKDRSTASFHSPVHDKKSELLLKELKSMQTENERLKAELKRTKSIITKQALPMKSEEVESNFVASGLPW
ncbi:hypothetical protein ACHQM5_001709 [Ranunculus cassubicifolius]